MFVWHLTRSVAVVVFLQYSAVQREIAGNTSVSVEGSVIKLSGPGGSIRFPNTHAVALILPSHIRKKETLTPLLSLRRSQVRGSAAQEEDELGAVLPRSC